MGLLVALITGAVASTALVVGGVSTYNSTQETSGVNPASVTYADE